MLRFAAVLGIVGFLTGFIAPIYLSDGNQGPLTGIFITGPGGVALGLLLGALAWARGWPRQKTSQVLWSSAGVSFLAVLAVCVPQSRAVADLVDGEIRACGSAGALKAEAVAGWRAYEARRPDRTTTDWAARFDQGLAERPGVVITMRAQRERSILRENAPWNRGRLKAGRWAPIDSEHRHFAAGGDCSRYAPGLGSVFLIDGGTGRWPPWGIAELLGVRTAQTLPADYAALATAP